MKEGKVPGSSSSSSKPLDEIGFKEGIGEFYFSTFG